WRPSATSPIGSSARAEPRFHHRCAFMRCSDDTPGEQFPSSTLRSAKIGRQLRNAEARSLHAALAQWRGMHLGEPVVLLDEQRWIRAAQHGDVSAFNQLVERYQALAYNVAYRTLGHAEDAADATQDALLSAFRAIGD